VVVAVALAVAFWPRHSTAGCQNKCVGPDVAAPAGVDPAQLGAARAKADLASCPTSTGAAVAADSPLRDITLPCLADDRPVSLAAALAGKPAIVSLWAYWCQPCAQELPVLQAYAKREGSAVTVVTVHSDVSAASALSRLADIGVRLPGVQDGQGRVRAAVGAPDAFPVSVLLRPDGTVAKLVVRPFTGTDDIAATVAATLGVTS
jgi:thiol-disulfide isomerase/thioredoxin